VLRGRCVCLRRRLSDSAILVHCHPMFVDRAGFQRNRHPTYPAGQRRFRARYHDAPPVGANRSLAPANGGREELLHRRADGRLPAGAHFSLSDLESGQRVSAILKLRSVFGNTHFRAVRFQSQLSLLPLVAIPALRVHGAGNLFRCREMFGRISVAKLDRYGPNLFGARSRCW
jgi:hypothetical protein